jgi:hypothetical protein
MGAATNASVAAIRSFFMVIPFPRENNAGKVYEEPSS